MKTRKYVIIGSLALALAGAIFAGCKKNTTTNTSTDTTAAQDDANAQLAIQDSKNISDGAAKGQASDRTAGGCETFRKFDTTINSTLDTALDIFFGNSDCTCTDGRTRRGHILVFWNGKGYFDSASSITMTFNNYYLNDIGISGTRTLTNAGKLTSGNQAWNFTAALTLTYPSGGGTATWNSTRVNVLKQVGSAWYYAVTGSASGTSRKGATYNINITSPLYVTALPWWLGGCKYIESGQLTVNVSSFSYPIYVNFGTAIGTCSNAATATINSVTFNFTQQ